MENDISSPKPGRWHHIAVDLQAIVKSLGLVFGDIASPIYTLTIIFLLLKPTPDNVMSCRS